MKHLKVGFNLFAKVSDVDFLYLSLLSTGWHVARKGYVEARVCGKKKKLHLIVAELMGLDRELQIDHKDRDKLNCQRDNLRSATNGQNRANSRLNSNNTSGFKGVHERPNGRWYAQINVNGEKRYLGSYATKEEAATVYANAAIRAFGGFANPGGGL